MWANLHIDQMLSKGLAKIDGQYEQMPRESQMTMTMMMKSTDCSYFWDKNVVTLTQYKEWCTQAFMKNIKTKLTDVTSDEDKSLAVSHLNLFLNKRKSYTNHSGLNFPE